MAPTQAALALVVLCLVMLAAILVMIWIARRVVTNWLERAYRRRDGGNGA